MRSQFFFPALGLLSGVGFLVALYFALVYHKLLQSDSTLLPQFCRMDERSCGSLLKTKESSLFGLPNFYLGLIYYSALIIIPMISERLFWKWWPNLAAASALTVAVGVYLTYALIAKLKVNCVLCFTGHVVNTLIAILMFSAL